MNPHDKPIAAGKSSFELIRTEVLFDELALGPASVFVDVACGPGHYSLAAAERIGPGGNVYAIDLWTEGIERLQKAAAEQGFSQLTARVADVSKHIPLADRRADVCLLATVLHDLMQINAEEGTLREISRILKPGGLLAVVEFKKIEGPPGPPIHIRLAPEDVEQFIRPFGFRKIKTVDLGPYNYLLLFHFQ